MTGSSRSRTVMGWFVYTITFEAAKPRAATSIPDADTRAQSIEDSLDWMEPSVRFTADGVHVRLTVHAPSADAAMAHVRGSFRSALHGAGIPAVGLWPVRALDVRLATDVAPPVNAAVIQMRA